MERVVIIGGGVSGCAAALAARKTGVAVELIERMESLSGLGPWTGQLMTWIIRQEAKLMDGGTADIINLMESFRIHAKPEFNVPDGNITFDVTRIEEGMLKLVKGAGIEVRLRSRVTDVRMEGNKMVAAILADGTPIRGDAFVDATGRAGGMEWCNRGQGCGMCLLKCTIYGDRAAIAPKANVPDKQMPPPWNYFTMPMFTLESLAPELQSKIEEAEGGYYYYPLPAAMVERDFTNDWPHPDRPITQKIPRLINGNKFEIVHVPYAKCRLVLPLKWFRRIPGFENAAPFQPLILSGQPVNEGSVADHDQANKVTGLANLFVGGLRVGRYGAFVEAMMAGDLAGYNAARIVLGREPITYPKSTLIGYFFNNINAGMTPNERSGPMLDDPRYQPQGFGHTDYQKIRERVENAGFVGIFGKKLL